MRRSHVEQRARKYAPVQYVSETHDHKPDAPARGSRPRFRQVVNQLPEQVKTVAKQTLHSLSALAVLLT